jgi:hypothetical protein
MTISYVFLKKIHDFHGEYEIDWFEQKVKILNDRRMGDSVV